MAICKRCGTPVDVVSRRGLCQDCSTKAMQDAAEQMHKRYGPLYDLAQSRRKAAMKLKKA